MKKLVTVIVPTIGRPKYIESSVNSILRQDYEKIEILISDNLPEISTASILGNHIDARVKIISRNHRYSFSEHMNLCIEEAHGYYIMILSDDDLISENYVSSMVNLFENIDVKVALGNQKILNENDTILKVDPKCKKSESIYDGVDFLINHFSGKSRFPIYTYLSLFAKKNDLIDIKGFKDYPDGSNADNYLFYSLALRGKVGISNSLMGYRVYLTSSGLSTPFDKLYDATYAYDKDISSRVWGIAHMPFYKKFHLRILIKISSARMMVYRLLINYKAKIGALATIINLARVLIVYLPSNIFSGFGYVNKLK